MAQRNFFDEPQSVKNECAPEGNPYSLLYLHICDFTFALNMQEANYRGTFIWPQMQYGFPDESGADC